MSRAVAFFFHLGSSMCTHASMAGLFDPRCSQPVYLMDSDDVASACGRLGGSIGGVLVGGIIAAVVFFWLSASTRAGMFASTTTALLSAIVAFAVLLFFFGWIGGAVMRQRHRASRLNMERYEKMGLTREEALIQESNLYNAEQLAASARSGGRSDAILSGALLGTMLASSS